MAVKILSSGTEILRIDKVQRIRYSLRMEGIEIPIPGESDPLLMQLGGVSRRLTIEWIEMGEFAQSVSKLANELMSGEMFKVYTIVIEEWNLTKDCVIFDVDIQQEAGESVMRCSLTVAIGVTI